MITKRRFLLARNVLAATGATLLLTACASTRVTSVWRAPDSGPFTLHGRKVAALVFSKNEARRRAAEEILVKAIAARGVSCVASFTIVPNRVARDEERARTRMKDAGIEAVVSMSVVDREKSVSYSPGYWTAYPRYRTFWGGWYGYGWGYAYAPPRRYVDRIVTVETLVYDLPTDKLVWAGMTKTTNPDDAEELYGDVAATIGDELAAGGLLR